MSAFPQNQALAVILFLYRDVLSVELPWIDEVVPAKRPRRLPVVLTREEVQAVLHCVMPATHRRREKRAGGEELAAYESGVGDTMSSRSVIERRVQ